MKKLKKINQYSLLIISIVFCFFYWAGESLCFGDLKGDILMIKDPFLSIIPIKPKVQEPPVVPKPPVQKKSNVPRVERKTVTQPKKEKEVQKTPVVEKPELPKIILSGTVVSPTKSYAIVNGKIVQLEDELDGFRIVEIRKREIAVFFAGETFLIRME